MSKKKCGKLRDYTNTKYLYITAENPTKVGYVSREQIDYYSTHYSTNYSNYFNPYFLSHYSGNYRIPKVTTIVGTVIPAIVLTLGNYMSVST
jgi:hypothetical protein